MCESLAADKPILRLCWSNVLRIADESSHDGAHIVAVHNVASQRPLFETDVFARHRLLWIDQEEMFKCYGTAAFTTILEEKIDFEERWRAELRPTIDKPLMLPHSVFKAKGRPSAIWERAQNVRIGFDDMDDINSLIQHFRKRYHTKEGYWVDEEGRRFKRGYHAPRVPPVRRWKFTVQVPLGFHFDVSREGNQEFSLCDASGVVRTYRHANVDCHGHVRGGH